MTAAPEIETWGPGIFGWSHDILPVYRRWAEELEDGSVFVELGVHHGRSLLFMASELARLGKLRCRVVGIDPSDYPEFRANLARMPSSVRDLVDMRIDWSVEASARFAPRSIAGVFLDGGHMEASVRGDHSAWTPKLVAGGILGGHDYGNQDWPDVARVVDELVPDRTIEGSVWWARR